MEASWKGHEKVVKLFLRAGVNKDVKHKEFGMTPLMIAILGGHENVVELLIKEGADKDASDNDGRTALMQAAQDRSKGFVEALLKAGAKIESKDKEGKTALMYAIKEYCDENTISAIKLLYGNFANVNAKDISGRTPIGLLYLLAIKRKGYRPIFISIINHELKILKKLLQKRVNNISI